MNKHKSMHDYPFDPLTEAQAEYAARLWAASKNTAEIASELRITEARVFNSMGVWMPRARALANWRRAQLDGKNLSLVRDHVVTEDER